MNSRKSKIYKNRPKFSIFGVGRYTFKPYKIGIAGFYKEPKFSLIFPIKNKPIILDDTCYQLSFNNFNDAFITWLLFNLDEVRNFILSISFLDSKRPFTKKVLMRIDILKILEKFKFDKINTFYLDNLKPIFNYEFTEDIFIDYKNKYLLKGLEEFLFKQ